MKPQFQQLGSLNAPLQPQPPPETGTNGKVGIVGSTANLANAAIGAGVLAFPLAYKQAGLILGPLLTIAFALVLGYTLHVISRAADEARRLTGAAGSYQQIVKVLLGPCAERVIVVLQAVYLTGCNICMLMIIRDQVKPVLVGHLGAHSWAVRNLLPLAAWSICFPLSLIRDMSWFAWPSSVSQLGIFYSVGVVIVHCVRAGFVPVDPAGSASSAGLDSLSSTPSLWGGGAMDIVKSLPLICFGFQCHLTFSLVYDSLAKPSPRRIDLVSGGCMLLCATLYITMGVFGYLLLGEAATADVLADLSKHGYLELCIGKMCIADVSLARYCVAIKVACSYAMLCHVTKVALKDLALGYDVNLSFPEHVFSTAAFVAITMFAAIGLGSKLQTAMAFSGILVVIMVAIFPGVLKLKISAGETGGRVIGFVLILFGVSVGVVSLVVEVVQLAS